MLETDVLDDAIRIRLFHDMLYVRRTEERIMALYGEQEMRCPTHFSIGQEAVSAVSQPFARRLRHARTARMPII